MAAIAIGVVALFVAVVGCAWAIGSLGARANGALIPMVPNGPWSQLMTGSETAPGLAQIVQDLLSIRYHDRLARHYLTHRHAQLQGMDGFGLLPRHGALCFSVSRISSC
jgi:hypothetical protein